MRELSDIHLVRCSARMGRPTDLAPSLGGHPRYSSQLRAVELREDGGWWIVPVGREWACFAGQEALNTRLGRDDPIV